MKPKLIDDFVKTLQKLGEEIELEPSETARGIMWLQGMEKLLKPVWQDGFDEGVLAGEKRERESTRITKSN